MRMSRAKISPVVDTVFDERKISITRQAKELREVDSAPLSSRTSVWVIVKEFTWYLLNQAVKLCIPPL